MDAGKQADPRSVCSREYYIDTRMIRTVGSTCVYLCTLATAAQSGEPSGLRDFF